MNNHEKTKETSETSNYVWKPCPGCFVDEKMCMLFREQLRCYVALKDEEVGKGQTPDMITWPKQPTVEDLEKRVVEIERRLLKMEKRPFIRVGNFDELELVTPTDVGDGDNS